MDAELRTHLEGMERRLDSRIEAVEQGLAAMEQRLDGRIEAVETKLLRAFYDWSSRPARGTHQ